MTREVPEARHPQLDATTLSWVDSRIKDAREAFEKRLSDEKSLLLGVLGLAAKICGVAAVLIFGTFGFFGYKDIAAIDDKISKAVNTKIEEKASEFNRIYEKNIQGLTDQALITAYNIQFAAPPKRFERQTILPSHLQRFVQIIGDQHSESRLLESLYDLLSEPQRDEKSALVDNKLLEMVAGQGTFSWMKEDGDRLAKTIDLLKNRSNTKNPSIVRAYLTNEAVPPAVRQSAVYYAEMARDRTALPEIIKLLDANKDRPPAHLLFAMASLDPNNKWVDDWTLKLKNSAKAGDAVKAYHEDVVLGLEVASKLLESAEKRTDRIFASDEDSRPSISFASAMLSLALAGGARFELDRDPFNEKAGRAYRALLQWPGEGVRRILDLNILMGLDGAVITKVCRDLFDQQGVEGLLRFAKATQFRSDGRNRFSYDLRMNVRDKSSFGVEIDGKQQRISNVLSRLVVVNENDRDVLKVRWRADDGTEKIARLSSLDHANSTGFFFQIDRSQEN
jgi:hypothetical protein